MELYSVIWHFRDGSLRSRTALRVPLQEQWCLKQVPDRSCRIHRALSAQIRTFRGFKQRGCTRRSFGRQHSAPDGNSLLLQAAPEFRNEKFPLKRFRERCGAVKRACALLV